MPSKAKRDKERRWKLARNAVWDCVPARLGGEVSATYLGSGDRAGSRRRASALELTHLVRFSLGCGAILYELTTSFTSI